jgi:pimeloyl-ACP methyl ester carboxylesterase
MERQRKTGRQPSVAPRLRHRPRLTLPIPDRPIVVIGFSAGSLVTPTVAARLREVYPNRVAAMILVGSGAPVFDVSRYSKLTDGGIVLTPPGGPAPDDDTIDALRERYLPLATMDPWNTALAIRDLPVLHIYAAKDKIVPARTARLLNDRLVKPDRLVYSGGHLGLFYFIPPQRERISQWLQGKVDAWERRSGLAR